MPFLLQVSVDTMLVRQVPPDRTSFEQVVFVAAGAAQVVTLVVVVLLAIIFYRMWRAQLAMQEQLGRLSEKLDPMIASATMAAENVRALTDVVKRDAASAAEALSEATTRVRDSVSGIADRIDDVGELLGRVTERAEAVSEVAAAAVSTFKAGRRLFRSRDDRVPRRAPSHEDAAAVDDELDEPRRLDDDDAHESPYAEDAAPAPRHRRRRHRRRRGGHSGGPGGASGEGPAA